MGLTNHDIRTAQASAYNDDGFPGVQCNSLGPQAGGPPIDMHHQFGFMSIPGDPDEDGLGCMMHTLEEGSSQHCFLSYDPRALKLLPRFKPRSVTQHSYYGGFDTFTGKDGSKQIYVPFALVGGVPTKAHVFEMRVDGGCTFRHASGAGVALTETSAIFNSPDGSCTLELKNNGEMVLNGNLRVTGTIGIGKAPTLPVATGGGPGSLPNQGLLLSLPGT